MLGNCLSASYLLNEWMDIDQTCTAILLRQRQELIRFFVTLIPFSRLHKGYDFRKWLEMTKPYRQNRTRLFLPIKGKQDISKSSVSRWISYTIKLAYRKLTRKDFLFLKIKAHEVRALSSSWAFFDKVPLNEILKAAVWNQSSTFAKFYLRDMSQQLHNLQDLGPIVAA